MNRRSIFAVPLALLAPREPAIQTVVVRINGPILAPADLDGLAEKLAAAVHEADKRFAEHTLSQLDRREPLPPLST